MHFNISGSAGAELAEIGDLRLHGKYDWLTLRVKSAGAALTDFAYDAVMTRSDQLADNWINRITGSAWQATTAMHDGEETGEDDQGNTNHVDTLGDGESVTIRLRVTGVFAVRFRAKGDGATVTISGAATVGA